MTAKRYYEMRNEPIYVAFATQKGGVGKSAFTVLAASYLQYVRRYNVAIVDCDFPQHSIHALRQRERERIAQDEYYRTMAMNHFAEIDHASYPIICSKAEDAFTSIKEKLTQRNEKFDVIFLDLPGTVNTVGVLDTLSQVDHIFTPIIADRFVLESSLAFASHLNESVVLNHSNRLKGIHLFWNLVDGRERTDLYDTYENGISSLGLDVLTTTIPDTKRFRKEMSADRRVPFRSTLLPPDKRSIKGSGVVELIDEICSIINLEPHNEG